MLGSGTANFVVKAAGQTTDPFPVPVALSAPGLFTSNTSGGGQVVAFNQDGSLNTPTTPAARGSYIVLYATGEGALNPIALDGAIQTEFVRVPFAPISITIGGAPASTFFAGAVPGMLSGVLLIEAVVPPSIGTGAVPIVVTAGSVSSTAAATISVK